MQELLPGEAPESAQGQEPDALSRLRLTRPLAPLPLSILIVAVAGGTLSLSLPPAELGPLALVALVPLFALVRSVGPRRGFLLGWVFGMAYFGATLYWILLFGELAWFALTATSAAFVGIFGMLAPVVWRGHRPVLSIVGMAAAWTAIEWIRGMVPLGGFTWGDLSTTQVWNVPLRSLASVTGAWGMTFVVALVNGLGLLALERVRGRPARAAVLMGAAAAVVTAPWLIPLPNAKGRPLDVAAIQVDVRPARSLGARAEDRAIARQHAALHRRLAADPPDLAVWGESSLDPGAATDPRTLELVTAAIRESGSPTLLSSTRPGDGGLHRDAVLLSAEGIEEASYSKVHLVPFGEFVPWRGALGWISALEQIPYDLTPGESVHVLQGSGLPSIGASICYENSFPGIQRELVADGAQVLVVLTNNASYEDTAASDQHLLMSRLRAVELGRWMVHGAISGISGIVDPSGRVVGTAGLFDEAILRTTVRASSATTVYARFGDWLPIASIVVALAVMAIPRRGRGHHSAAGPLPEGARTLVILPTYDERETIELVIEGVVALPGVEVLVVDDGSPDGTAELVRGASERHSEVRLIERTEKGGLASAYLAGFDRALAEGYDLVVEMDADLSHRPEDLPRLLAAAGDSDVVIGSRYVPGGSVTNWSAARIALSRAGNLYGRLALGFPLRDATSGFRVYRREALADILAAPVRSDGYGFQIELALRAWNAGYSIVEVPISFREREHGRSKISRRIVAEALWLVTVWGLRARLRPDPR